MNWPEPFTLKALLELWTISGQTRASIERYLDDPRKWERDYNADAPDYYTDAAPDLVAAGLEAYRIWKLTHGTASGLKDGLNNAVQAHWNELVKIGAV